MRETPEIIHELNFCWKWFSARKANKRKSDDILRGALFIKMLRWVLLMNRNLPHNDVDYAFTTSFRHLNTKDWDVIEESSLPVRKENEILSELLTVFEFTNLYLRILLGSEGPLTEQTRDQYHRKFQLMQDACAVLSWVMKRPGTNTPSLLLCQNKPAVAVPELSTL